MWVVLMYSQYVREIARQCLNRADIKQSVAQDFAAVKIIHVKYGGLYTNAVYGMNKTSRQKICI